MGCGRYSEGHAHGHYKATGHLYALEIETQRVWDYAGDGYVHRLVMNKEDGKMVEIFAPDRLKVDGEEKIESLGLEYSYLLSLQMEDQRAYYEGVLKNMRDGFEKTLNRVESERDSASLRLKDLSVSSTLEVQKLQRKLEKSITLNKALSKDLSEERALNDGYRARQEEVSGYQNTIKERELTITDLEEQLKDLMFFLETRDKVENDPELANGQLVTEVPVVKAKRKSKKR